MGRAPARAVSPRLRELVSAAAAVGTAYERSRALVRDIRDAPARWGPGGRVGGMNQAARGVPIRAGHEHIRPEVGVAREGDRAPVRRPRGVRVGCRPARIGSDGARLGEAPPVRAVRAEREQPGVPAHVRQEEPPRDRPILGHAPSVAGQLLQVRAVDVDRAGVEAVPRDDGEEQPAPARRPHRCVRVRRPRDRPRLPPAVSAGDQDPATRTVERHAAAVGRERRRGGVAGEQARSLAPGADEVDLDRLVAEWPSHPAVARVKRREGKAPVSTGVGRGSVRRVHSEDADHDGRPGATAHCLEKPWPSSASPGLPKPR